MFRMFTLAAPVAAAFALTAGAAQAEDFMSNGRTAQVYHGDLNLADADQQKTLRSRIARAAARVCSSSDRMTALSCKSKAIAHVEAPMAAAIARAETGERYADAGSEKVKETRAIVGN
ncbi:UrcA family protein [Sphingobium soli]|uniref:UrcA family protein n=1 Tax=Sphingobium soli TaxID=1591116 RepID=A0ABS8H3E9_9SPHN|nr:UrcA family protein [Sphingobium soli]MCC4233077.1 UrcA family protein [Sphingobium soli]